jgi:hypothetical protein
MFLVLVCLFFWGGGEILHRDMSSGVTDQIMNLPIMQVSLLAPNIFLSTLFSNIPLM